MLDLHRIDLAAICGALEDHSYDHQWWLDPTTGEVEISTDLHEDGENTTDKGLVPIEPIPSHESYQDLVDFTSSVRDPRARDLLERAIAGRGAFRRFKDTLFDFPELRQAWFEFHDARMLRRAVRWLADQGLIEQKVAEREISAYPDPTPPTLAGPFDPLRIAREVEEDLSHLYGARLRQVVLFGSWARGDAHPESDIDLMVVLDRVESPWVEMRRMDEILWRHSIDNDTVVTALPVAEADLEPPRSPALVRARLEGRVIA